MIEQKRNNPAKASGLRIEIDSRIQARTRSCSWSFENNRIWTMSSIEPSRT
jgi:hypothetical protein